MFFYKFPYSTYMYKPQPCVISSHQRLAIACLTYAEFPPYLENLENVEFCHFLFQAWKMPGICSKSGKNLEF